MANRGGSTEEVNEGTSIASGCAGCLDYVGCLFGGVILLLLFVLIIGGSVLAAVRH